MKLPSSIVSAQWLAAHLNDPNLLVLDSHLNPTNTALQIKDARIFNVDNIADPNSPLPHMMPNETVFTHKMRELGVCNHHTIVIYDSMGLYLSPRAWWMLKAMGHEQVAVLNGGLPAWVKEGLPCEDSHPNSIFLEGDFVANPSTTHFCTVTQVENAMQDNRYSIIDARAEIRFLGLVPEPRNGLKQGHIPNSQNIPFETVLENGQYMKPVAELQQIFSAKVEPQQKLIFSCGSGITACILALAAELCGYTDISVYDGSWSEWGLEGASHPISILDHQ